MTIAAVNKEPEEALTLSLNFHSAKGNVKLFTISGNRVAISKTPRPVAEETASDIRQATK